MFVGYRELLVSLRHTLYRYLENPAPKGKATRALRLGIQVLILLNVLAVVFESLDAVHTAYANAFHLFELVSVLLFSIEYLLRIWASAEAEGSESNTRKRLRFLLSPLAMIDLVAILPFYLTFTVVDLRFIRAFRLFRLVRIVKMARYWAALTMFARVFKRKRAELVSSFLVFLVFLVVNSGCLYFAEMNAPGSPFTSIPAAMWWGVITMTTVGYGDMVPVTVLGKIFGAITAIVGVGLFAIFAGVMVSGFTEELQRHGVNEGQQD